MLAVDRHEQHPGLGHDRAQMLGGAEAEAVGQLDAHGAHAGSVEQRRRATERMRTRAARSRRASLAETAAMSRDPGSDLQAHTGVGGELRQDRVGR